VSGSDVDTDEDAQVFLGFLPLSASRSCVRLLTNKNLDLRQGRCHSIPQGRLAPPPPRAVHPFPPKPAAPSGADNGGRKPTTTKNHQEVSSAPAKSLAIRSCARGKFLTSNFDHGEEAIPHAQVRCQYFSICVPPLDSTTPYVRSPLPSADPTHVRCRMRKCCYHGSSGIDKVRQHLSPILSFLSSLSALSFSLVISHLC